MIICIDPGLGGTGYAVFSKDKDKLFPEETGVLHCKAIGSWTDRQTEIVNKLDDLIDTRPTGLMFTVAYIELPTMFQTAKGMSCATGKNDGDSDLVKLAVLIGRLQQLFCDFYIPVILIRVNDWKGTMSKHAVAIRIARRLKCSPKRFGNHACDAVGIGLHIKDAFKAKTEIKAVIKPRRRK